MRKDDCAAHRAANVGFDLFEQLMTLLHRPASGNQNVNADELSGSGLARAQSMVVNAFIAHELIENFADLLALRAADRRVHQTERRTAHQTYSDPSDVNGDKQRNQRIEKQPASPPNRDYSKRDAD